jgi:hypothetical protein
MNFFHDMSHDDMLNYAITFVNGVSSRGARVRASKWQSSNRLLIRE